MNKIKTIGVIVITYNGERYISQQLESIRKQTIKPDRVLIFDDCSLDRTAAIVSDFILKYDLCNWELFQNSQNVGWGENGFRALLRCDTDIIFWSDQDDVWRRDKIETFVLQMEKQVYLAMYSGWSYIDSNGYRINHFAGKGTRNIYTVDPFYKGSSIPPLLGCSACFRKELVSQLSEIFPCEFASPDWILYYLGITLGMIGYIDLPLFQRRIHQSNVTVSSKNLKRSWLFSYEKHKSMIEILIFQIETLNKMIEAVKKSTFQYDLSFVESERDYLMYRVGFLNNQKNLFCYFAASFYQNSIFDFLNTIMKDSLFVYHENRMLSFIHRKP